MKQKLFLFMGVKNPLKSEGDIIDIISLSLIMTAKFKQTVSKIYFVMQKFFLWSNSNLKLR